jgi:hypothetical protein
MKLTTKLKQLKKSEINGELNHLKIHVIDYILSRYSSDEEIEGFFQDITNNGCISGMVGHLIYYSDTRIFFDKFYKEIEDLRIEYEESTGCAFQIKYDLRNTLAWFAFEEICYRLVCELELDI